MGIEIIKQALTDAFIEVDREMLRQEYASRWCALDYKTGKAKLDESGCTCCMVMVTPKHIICANAGDTRACYRTGGKTIQLSLDHKPHHDVEQSRIEAAGGYVSMKRVDGDLAVSRGLGDFRYKDNTDLPPDRQKVSCIPDFIVHERDPENDEFLVIACDGIFDVMSCEQVTDAIQHIFDEGETDLGIAAEELLDYGLEKESKDNMTVIIVSFNGVKISEQGGGVEARRAMRRMKVEEDRRLKEAKERARAELKSEANIVRQRLLARARREELESDSDIGD